MPKIKDGPNWSLLVTALEYDPSTGIFRWKINVGRYGRIKAGSIAGGVNKEGYRQIMIAGKHYRANRLAWFYVTKEWPDCVVDHRNGKVDDNRFENLRKASDSQSMANRDHKNKHGVKGVSTKRGLFRARIYHDGKSIHIGYYATKIEAHAAYLRKSMELQGDFSYARRK